MTTMIKVHDFEVDLDLLRRTRLHIAIPCYGGMLSEATFTGMMKWSIFCRQHNLDYFVDTIFNESLIPRGRNSHTAKFLDNPNATHLMFIDADIGFEPWHIVSLIRREADIVGGLYPMKSLPINYVVNQIPGVNVPTAELQQVATIGTGFMLIKRNVFTKMYEHPEVTRYKQDIGLDPKLDAHMATFFDCAVKEGRYFSEDWLFCHRWRELGGQIWADTKVKLIHFGAYAFGRDLNK
jgi:hypothetical protein